EASSSLLQPDHKLIVGGWTNQDPNNPNIGLLRLLSDGTPDPAFGVDHNGFVAASFFDNTGVETVLGIALQGGNIIVSVTIIPDPSQPKHQKFGFMRFTRRGLLDTSFGGPGANGRVVVSFAGALSSGPKAVTVQADGKIVAVGGTSYPDASSRCALARL